jgi:hypothetical protein
MRTRFGFDNKHVLGLIDASAILPANVRHLAHPLISFAAWFVERKIVRR